MSNVIIEKSKIDILANAISAKSGELVTMTLDEMIEAVDGIETNPPPTLQTKSVTYTPSTSAVTGTVTADSGYDGLEEVDVTVSAVPMADAGPAAGIASFITESGVRKWKFEYGAYAEAAGWVDEGSIGTNSVYKYNAVPSNTTVTPTESSQTVGGAKYMMEGAVTVSAIPSNYVGSGVTQRSSTDLTASGATVTAPAGYYASSATKTVASGTEGTPTATKGTVSNNSVSVTPSVTNTAGYVSGGTHTGTAVTVTASELVSGSQTITTNGTVDVTNLEEVVVNVSSSGDGGGPSYELTTIVPEQTVTSASPPQDDTDMLLLTSSDVLVEGDYYIVTVNGQKRAQTAVRNNYVLYLADITDAWYRGDRTVLMAGSDLYFCPWDAGSYTVKVEHLVLKSSGSGGVIRENIVPQQTITATAGYNGLTSTAVLIEGADYEYTVNGETRLGTAVDVNGTLQLGDGDYYWLEEGGCIATDGSVMYFRTSAAGTYTVKVDKITLANSGLKTQVIFPEQSVTATTTEQSGYSANISVSENITDGANYIVTMDGTAYLCYGKQLYGNNDVYCGDDTVIWGTPANARYPFMVATWGNGTTAWGVADTTAHTVKIEKVLSFDSAELGTKTITANGTYTASTDDLDGYSTITVNVSGGSPTIQSLTVTPSTSQQTFNASGVDGYKPVTVNAIPSEYIIPTGNKAITENGNNIDVAQYSTVSVNVSGASKNAQTAQSTTRATTASYTEVVSLTCTKTGTYDVYWSTFRSSTSGTWGSQLYLGGTAYGSAQTGSWSNHIQNIHLSNVSITANQSVAVRVRSRGSNYYGYVGTLTIIEA